MIHIIEVQTKKQQKEFLSFPLKLYKDNPYFVPPLYGDEKQIFRSDYAYYTTCEAVYYNAYRENKMVGRISGILQKDSNKKNAEKRVRFTRFDCIDDQEAACALFQAVECWAISKGMDTVCGPLGFSDQEREGLLVEGFEELSTFAEQYNAEYYGRLIEGCGYQKEVDWVESKIYLPAQPDEKLKKMADLVMKRHSLHFAEAKNAKEFLHLFADELFELLDTTYADLYGTVPFNEATKRMLLKNFSLVLDMKYMTAIMNEKDQPVCLGICMPSLSQALQGSSGRLTPLTLLKLLKALRHPKIIDLAFIAVAPDYMNRGVNAVVLNGLMEILGREGIQYAETNLNLETNLAMRNQWKRFQAVQHKRRRAYVKSLII